jgi:hypothetical protein
VWWSVLRIVVKRIITPPGHAHSTAQRGYVIGRCVGIYAKVQFNLLKYLLSELHSGSRRLPIISRAPYNRKVLGVAASHAVQT